MKRSLFLRFFLASAVAMFASVGSRHLNRDAVRTTVKRSVADLSPLPVPAHRELAPLVQSTDDLMDRLGHKLRREQEFLGDAAHQLNTPPAIVQSNAAAGWMSPCA